MAFSRLFLLALLLDAATAFLPSYTPIRHVDSTGSEAHPSAWALARAKSSRLLVSLSPPPPNSRNNETILDVPTFPSFGDLPTDDEVVPEDDIDSQNDDLKTPTMSTIQKINHAPPYKAVSIAQAFQDEFLLPDLPVRPVLQVWSAASRRMAPSNEAAKNAQKILGDSQDPESVSLVIEAWTKSKHASAATTIQGLIRRVPFQLRDYGNWLEACSSDLNQANTVHQKMLEQGVRIPRSFYTHRLTACLRLARTDPTAAIIEAKRIHQELLQAYDNTDVVPTSILMEILSKFPNPQQAEAYFQQMERPNVYSYTALIKNYKTTNSTRPVELFCAAIQENYPEHRHVRLYSAVLHTVHSAARALIIVKHLRSQTHIRDRLQGYNLGILSCANDTPNAVEALRAALAIYRVIEQPDAFTYENLLLATHQLLPQGKERNQVAVAVLQKAIADQVVTHRVLQQFYFAVSMDVLNDTLQPHMSPTSRGKYNFQEIPRAWRQKSLTG